MVDIKAISSSDVNSRIAHALGLAAERYDVPSLFEPEGKKFISILGQPKGPRQPHEPIIKKRKHMLPVQALRRKIQPTPNSFTLFLVG